MIRFLASFSAALAVFSVSALAATRPSHDCGTGTGMATVAARVSACATANGSTATWTSTASGYWQATWNLVTRLNGYEVWQDTSTSLLWSDDVDYANQGANWCQAAGITQNIFGPGYCGDTEGTCSDGSSPDEGTCLGVAGQTWAPAYQSHIRPLSFCAEVDASSNPLFSAISANGLGNGENFAAGVYDQTKGGMGRLASATSPAVKWQLPTSTDLQRANVDGIRYVLPNFGLQSGASLVWSGTDNSGFPIEVTFPVGDIGLSLNPQSATRGSGVRCLGR